MSQGLAQDAARPTIAVFGTGKMGAPIARDLLAAGFSVDVWDHTTAHTAPLARDGATLAWSPADAAQRAEVVLTMLPDGEAVADVMGDGGGALAVMRPGSAWIQMGTIGLDWIERCAALAAEHRVELVDAPVSGSDGPAREHQLVVLASGPDTAGGECSRSSTQSVVRRSGSVQPAAERDSSSPSTTGSPPKSRASRKRSP